jgi:glyoxalase family protein
LARRSRGHKGTSEIKATAFLISEDSVSYWKDRFKSRRMEFRSPYKRFDDEQVITLHDPDGLELELVAHKSALEISANIWKQGPKCIRVVLSHTKNGFPSLCCRWIKSLAAATNSSSQVSIRFLVSGPVSSIFCLPTFPHRGIAVGSSSSVAQECITPRGPKVSKNCGNFFQI